MNVISDQSSKRGTAMVFGVIALVFSTAIPALDCNTVVYESITLAEEIVCSRAGDVGLTVASGSTGITIDLNGHSISGGRKERSIGILVEPGASDASIVNGTVASFDHGVVVSNASGVVITGLTAAWNRRDGISVRNSNAVTLVDNELVDNSNGIVGIDVDNLTAMSNRGGSNSNVDFDITGGANVSLTNNESRKEVQRAAFRVVGPASVTLTANRANGYKGFGYQFANAPTIIDGGSNSARGARKRACFPDPCPLTLQ